MYVNSGKQTKKFLSKYNLAFYAGSKRFVYVKADNENAF